MPFIPLSLIPYNALYLPKKHGETVSVSNSVADFAASANLRIVQTPIVSGYLSFCVVGGQQRATIRTKQGLVLLMPTHTRLEPLFNVAVGTFVKVQYEGEEQKAYKKGQKPIKNYSLFIWTEEAPKTEQTEQIEPEQKGDEVTA